MPFSQTRVLRQPQAEKVELAPIDPSIDRNALDDPEQRVDGFLQAGRPGKPVVGPQICVHCVPSLWITPLVRWISFVRRAPVVRFDYAASAAHVSASNSA